VAFGQIVNKRWVFNEQALTAQYVCTGIFIVAQDFVWKVLLMYSTIYCV